MPKKRTSPLTPSQIELLAFMRRTEDPFPQNPVRLRALAGALLIRISAKDKDLGTVLMGTIRGWTNLEAQRSESPEGDMLDEIDEVIARTIAAGVPNKLSHMQPTILVQSTWLRDYLTQNSFPTGARNQKTQTDWVICHTTNLLRELGSYPCRCSYPSSFDGWLPKDAVGPCKTIIRASDYLLAHLHKIERSNLLKLMKPSQLRCIQPSSSQTIRPSNR